MTHYYPVINDEIKFSYIQISGRVLSVFFLTFCRPKHLILLVAQKLAQLA